MRRHREAGAQQPNHRNHLVGGSREIGVEKAERLDEMPGDAGFLLVSRSAAATGLSSPSSMRPPGKATWPAWRLR